MTPELFMEWSLDAAFVMVMVAIALAFVRLALGPTLHDRVVALDMMTVLIVAFCALYAIRNDDSAFLDIVIVLALVGFLATVALARFAERRLMMREERGEDIKEDRDD